MDQEIRAKLEQMAEQPYRQFQQGLLPGVQNILGVRMPALRQMARQLMGQDWQNALDGEDLYQEEMLLRGILVASAPMPPEQREALIRDYVPRIGNWAVCDSFCTNLRQFAAQNRQLAWQLSLCYLQAEQEFSVRFGIVMLLEHFLDPEHLEDVLCHLDRVRHPGYYVRMAVAWAVSMAYLRDRDQVTDYLKKCTLDPFTYHKALQKIRESRRVTEEDKEKLESMKRERDKRAAQQNPPVLKKQSIPPEI